MTAGDFNWSQGVMNIYSKLQKAGYQPTDDEWYVIGKPEYAFYQVIKRFERLADYDDDRLQLIRTDVSTIGHQGASLGSQNTMIADWICELIQNAIDKEASHCRIIVNNDSKTIQFQHNGIGVEGPQKPDKHGDVWALVHMGVSLKTLDPGTEGRFGLGFKYWTNHFKTAQLEANGFSVAWNKEYKLIESSHSKTGSDTGWTNFTFSDFEGNSDDGILSHSDLKRARDAIRLRTTGFRIEFDIDGDVFIWNHSVDSEVEIDSIRLLSCTDVFSSRSLDGSESEISEERKSTLALFNQDYGNFSEEDRSNLKEIQVEELRDWDNGRTERGMQSQFDKSSIESIVDEFIEAKPLVLGFFHHEEDKGSIMSMFPIVNEGNSRSRISFSAPFAIEPDRMNLRNPENDENPKKNRILIRMLMSSFGHFLRVVQNKDCDLLDWNHIRFLMENPPGHHAEDEDCKLDDLIRRFSSETTSPGYWRVSKLNQEEILQVECWPTKGGVMNQIGIGAKQLDPLLIEYSQILMDEGNNADLEWLYGNLEEGTILLENPDGHHPEIISNWISEYQEGDSFRFSRIKISEEEE